MIPNTDDVPRATVIFDAPTLADLAVWLKADWEQCTPEEQASYSADQQVAITGFIAAVTAESRQSCALRIHATVPGTKRRSWEKAICTSRLREQGTGAYSHLDRVGMALVLVMASHEPFG